MLISRKFYIFIVSTIFLILIGFFEQSKEYEKDIFLSILLIAALFLFYEKIKLTEFSYSIVCFALILHNIGSFGLYSKPVFGVPYDFITHFTGIFAATLVIANILSNNLSKDHVFRLNDSIILFLIFLSALGIGSLVETIEFSGFLIWGEGEGFLAFGAGDYDIKNIQDVLTERVGGGYFDVMNDLIYNITGALSGIILFGITFFMFKKNRI